jgi:hypothetical protein
MKDILSIPSKLSDALRATFVAPEILSCLLTVVVATRFSHALLWLAQELSPRDFGGKATFLGVPITLLVCTYVMSSGLLQPVGRRKDLVAWPGYWRLKLRVWVALAYSTLALLTFFVGWYIYQATPNRQLGAGLTLGGLLVSATSLVTVALARIQLPDVMDGQ